MGLDRPETKRKPVEGHQRGYPSRYVGLPSNRRQRGLRMQGMVLEEDIGACRRQQYVWQATLAMVSVLILTRLRMH